jgi:hypothetical protein
VAAANSSPVAAGISHGPVGHGSHERELDSRTEIRALAQGGESPLGEASGYVCHVEVAVSTRGWEQVQPVERVSRRPRPCVRLPQERRSKYRAIRTVVDGITFDSQAEAKRYGELKALEKAGAIRQLRCQVAFALSVRDVKIGQYVADFVYDERIDQDWCTRVEDVKGAKTLPLARWKMKHLTAEYGITVREIR